MKILAIGAHLDDIELSCGGFLAKASFLGHEVNMVVLSDSSYKNYNGKILRTQKQALLEGKNAAKKLKVKKLKILNLQTKKITFDYKTVELIEKEIDSFKPELILGHWPYDTHQDHVNTGLSTLAAARYFRNILIFEPLQPSSQTIEVFKPQLYVDVTKFIDQKIAAIKRHQSQYQKYGPRWIDDIYARARFRGTDVGYNYAESFQVVRLDAEQMRLI